MKKELLVFVHQNHPALKIKSVPVPELNREVKKLIRDMKYSLKMKRDPGGVAVAAPQFGFPLKIFITWTDQKNFKVYINPVVKLIGRKTKKAPAGMEGCLSLPGTWGFVYRYLTVEIKYRNENWEIVGETISGFEAVAIQHEYDHLQGIFFTDHIKDKRKILYQDLSTNTFHVLPPPATKA